MNHQSHQNHIYQCWIIENNLKANEKDQRQQQLRQQQQQALQENLALRQLRRQQQQHQQQQHQINVVDLDREDTPPNDHEQVIRRPQRPQKEQGVHRALMNFKDSSSKKWRRQRSCNRIDFIEAFDGTNNKIPKDNNVIQMVDDQITINDDNTIALINDDKPNEQKKPKPRAKSMSSFEPATISKDEAEIIASSVLQILDKRQAFAFVKDALMKNVHISSITREEISTVVSIHEASLSTNSNTSTSTEGDLSYHSVPSSSDHQSPVSVDINSGAVQFSPSKTTPKKVPPPPRPTVKQERRQWKQKLAIYDQAYTQLVSQLVNPQQPQPQQPRPSTSKTVHQQPPPLTSPRTQCNLCDNSRFFVFSPETRKKLTCSCSNQVLNNWKEPELPVPAAVQSLQSQQQQETETTLPLAPVPTPSKRVTHFRGQPQGVWDKTTQMFKKFKQ